jgi:hypothetical protein
MSTFTRVSAAFVVGAAVFICGLVFATPFNALAAPATAQSFAWFGELVALDKAAKTLTVKAPIEPHVSRYVSRFTPGQSIVLLWMTFDGEAGSVRYITGADAVTAESGYLVRAEFVSADAGGRTVTFKTPIPDTLIRTLAAASPGAHIKVGAPVVPQTRTPAITSVALNATPKPRPAPKADPAMAAAANLVKLAGAWMLDTNLMGNALKLSCDVTQEGAKIGGKCKGPGPLGELPLAGKVDGDAVSFQFDVSSFGPTLTLLYRGTVDATAASIKGISNLMGMDTPFTMVRQ